jgi:plasmid rolling circle replication initiator protein Rep
MTEKRKPSLDDALAGESSKGFDQICNFSSRVQRYSDAKSRQLQIVNHIRGLSQGGQLNFPLHSSLDLSKLTRQLCSCGNYLVFHQYHTVGQVRLAKASFCKNHLMCQLCAIRRGAKQVQGYLGKYEQVTASNASLRPYMLTLTVKNGHDLPERFQHLQSSMKKLMQRRRDFISKGLGNSQLAKAEGGVFSYELTKTDSGWHPHCHMVVMLNPDDLIDFPFDTRPQKFDSQAWAQLSPGQKKYQKDLWRNWGGSAQNSGLAKEWEKITGDSKIVDLRPIDGDPAQGFVEVFKYALKFSDLKPKENIEAYSYLKGKRLTGSFGCFWGVKVDKNYEDDLLADLPYIELFYKYTKSGYSLENVEHKDSSTYSSDDLKMLRRAGTHRKDPLPKPDSVFHTNRHLNSIIDTVGYLHTHKDFKLSREGPAKREGDFEFLKLKE